MTRVGFARWRSSEPSGGNTYDDEIAAGLLKRGVDLREYAVTDTWPLPEQPDARERFAGLLDAERHWLVDNIVGSAAPRAIQRALRCGRRVALLMHYFPADEPSLPEADRKRLAASEQDAVTAATTVIVTSAWAAAQVADRYGRGDAVIAVPGVRLAAKATGSMHNGRPPILLWLARLTPTKDPLTLIAALEELTDLDWTARLVGPDAVDPQLTEEVLHRISASGLRERIEVTGPQQNAALDATWNASDLLVHTSRFETYGMVVAEAHARGIPAVVPAGTGAVEAHQAGALFTPGDPASLAAVLRAWLTDPDLRDKWRADARHAHSSTWEQTVTAVHAALTHE